MLYVMVCFVAFICICGHSIVSNITICHTMPYHLRSDAIWNVIFYTQNINARLRSTTSYIGLLCAIRVVKIHVSYDTHRWWTSRVCNFSIYLALSYYQMPYGMPYIFFSFSLAFSVISLRHISYYVISFSIKWQARHISSSFCLF